MAHLSLSLLGPFQVTLGGEPVTDFESDKVRALLAYLAVEAHRPHRREVLAGLLWPDWPDRAARTNLRNALANLRQAIGDRTAALPFLLITRETIQFNTASDYWLDVAAFRASVEADQAGQPAVRQLEEAVALYQGSFLEGFSPRDSAAFEDWSLIMRERLQRQALAALHRLAGYYEQRGEYEQAQSYAWRQVELEPWDEEAHQQLMRALAFNNQRGAALAQYETCRRLLAEELGVEPAKETTRLYERIRDGAELSALSPAPPHNLPAPLTPFVGREAELAELEDRLQDPACRLLTLVGPGGSGKTRLALEAAATQINNFDHGVFFIPLAPLQSIEAVVPTVAQALGFSFHGEGESQQQLLNHLRQKTMLLVMDNFEHLLDGVGVVTDILKTSPDVTILTTSRARLNVWGEHLFPIAGMDSPALTPGPSPDNGRGELKDVAQYSAVRLFLQSARRARPDFELTADNLMDVARICRLVEGMPLGILLAAAWVGMLTPAEIAERIDQSLDFLETDWRDVPERQRSLRAVFDHSWGLLTEREREVFQALSVFRGGFTQPAARQVTSVSLRELKALIDKSLLHRTPAGRYEVHELLRQYATEKLDQTPAASEAARDRHSAYYAAALQQWAADLKGPRQQAALAEIEAESENARAAWNWAVEREQVEHIGQALEGLCLFYRRRGRYQEGEAACRTAAGKLASAASGDQLRVLVRVLTEQGGFNLLLGRTAVASQLLRQSLALLERPELAGQDTRREKALALMLMGSATRLRGADAAETRRLWEQSLALCQALGDRWMMADVFNRLGRSNRDSGAYDEAQRLCKESLEIRRALGDQSGIADSLALLSHIAWARGHFEEQERLAREAVVIWQELGNRSGIADGLGWLGNALSSLGKFAKAHSLREESLAIYNDLGFRGAVASTNVSLGFVKMHLGQWEGARALGQEGLTLGRAIGPQMEGYALLLLGSVALAEEAYAEAQVMLQESAALYAEEEMGWIPAVLAYAARRLGQLTQAREHLHNALRTATEIGAFVPLMYALPAIALLLADQGEKERAVELYALASRYPLVAHSRWFEDVARQHIGAIAATLPPDVVAAAQERGRARDLEATVAELLVELGKMKEANDD